MMEAGYSKDEIISLYLNQIFFGHGAYGVESASILYFNKHVWDLSLAECAVLASLPSAPNRYSPVKNPKLAISRHKMVLAKMVELGFTTVGEAEQAFLTFWPDYLNYISDISPSDNTWSTRTDNAPWFTEYVRRHLVKTYGEETVFEKGLSVHTTLDVNKQAAAQKQVEKHLARQLSTSSSLSFDNDEYIIENFTDTVSLISELFDIPDFRKKGSRQNDTFNKQFQESFAEELEALNIIAGLDTIDTLFDEYKLSYLDNREFQKVEGCLISINPTNGYIEALVGGSEFTSINQLIRPFQSLRQPGSAIKPLIYAAAIESGEFTPSTTVLDSPIVYLDNEGGDWIPENYERDFYGFLRLRRALALSVNVVSIRIADKLGIEYLMRYIAKLLRFDADTAKKRIPRNFSIALGSMEVSPYELTRAYAIIANGGKDVMPYSIRYVKDREGNILENNEADIKARIEKSARDGSLQVIKPETAQIMISMMRSVITEGTGGAASPGRPAAGKTGTTNNFKDAWFIGFTPQLATGVWIGYDKMGLSLGSGQSGGGISAPLWGAYMRDAMRNEPVLEFPSYAPLAERSVCKKSGMLPSDKCTETMNEIFSPSALPDKECDLCPGLAEHGPSSKTVPKENVSGRQRESILKNLKETNDSIFNDSVDDLLDKK
jgi:penicillin-binding protein 1A